MCALSELNLRPPARHLDERVHAGSSPIETGTRSSRRRIASADYRASCLRDDGSSSALTSPPISTANADSHNHIINTAIAATEP